MNLAFKEQHKKIVFQSLEELIHPTKLEKEHPIKATRQYLHEGSQIAAVWINRVNQKVGFLI